MQVFLIVVVCLIIGILVEGRQSEAMARANVKVTTEKKTRSYFVAKRFGFFAAKIVAKYF